jgi:DNA polymerase III epsilon subunit-like protein
MLRRIDAPVPPSHEDARARISELLQVGCVLLDTETTGLGYDAEVIELAVLSSSGETLLDTLIRPQSGFIPARVSAVHGLTMADVEDAPGFADVYDELLRITAGKAVLAWNASFDERMVRQSAVRWGLRERVNGFECSMRLYALSCRLRGGRAQLERVARVTGVLQNEAQSHRALEDARISLGVLRHVAAGGCGSAGPTDPAALST